MRKRVCVNYNMKTYGWDFYIYYYIFIFYYICTLLISVLYYFMYIGTLIRKYYLLTFYLWRIIIINVRRKYWQIFELAIRYTWFLQNQICTSTHISVKMLGAHCVRATEYCNTNRVLSCGTQNFFGQLCFDCYTIPRVLYAWRFCLEAGYT